MSKSFTFETITSHVRSSGFVFQGSEIYGGLANTWDYGPLGAELKRNVKEAWWKKFVQENPYNVGLDSAILMNPNVWVASGHVDTFNDPLMDCKKCKMRHRADHLIEEFDASIKVEGKTTDEMMAIIKENHIPCPNCGAHDFTDIRKFQLMFKTFQGVTEDAKSTVYLRPETAQGIFVNFKNIQRSMRRKIPFGVGQIGKSFRNEITPGNFTFRTREFEQMELEFFLKPGDNLYWYNYWKDFAWNWLLSIGIAPELIRLREHEKEELSHYSNATSDIEFLFPFGWGELWGIADRTDFDLKAHTKVSGEALDYLDPETNTRYVPHVVEPSLGADRLALALMCAAYDEEQIKEDDSRIVMRFHPFIAPIKAAILPLSKQLGEQARSLYSQLAKQFNVEYDETGSIGKRYRRQDAIGTPFCITVDFDTASDQSVTIRERDSMQQIRLPIADLLPYLQSKITL